MVIGSAAAVVSDGVGYESESAGDGFGGEFPSVAVDFDKVTVAPFGGFFAFVDGDEVAPQLVFKVGSPVTHAAQGSAGESLEQ